MSSWQERITGDWIGVPAVFDAEGTCVGRIQVERASRAENGRTTYTMDTRVDVRGPLRARFEAKDFSFGVIDGEKDRVYLGPDFVGAGHPFGALVDANYYSPGWQADLRTLVHVLEDGRTQVYSSQLYDGPSMIAVFNGVYRRHDGDAAALERFLEKERAAGETPHVLPFKDAGAWTGRLAVYGADQSASGHADVEISYAPRDLLHAAVELRVRGAVELEARFVRARSGHRHFFEGPDLFGNGIAYGRALYTTQHLYGRALKIRGREFLLDAEYRLAVVWHVYASDRLKNVLFGTLAWQPGERVLSTVHVGT
jgi:hypothetical protein